MVKKVCVEDISILGKIPFAVENAYMRRSNVTPPSHFKCRKGHLEKSRFFYVIEGVFIVDTGKKEPIVAKSGDIIYLPNDIEYESEWLPNAKCSYITLECNLISPDREDLILLDDVFIICQDKSEKYLKTMVKAYEYFNSGTISSGLQMISLIYSFLGDIIEDVEKRKLRDNDIASPIYKGIVYMNDNYRESISVKEVADLCNVSESTFRRKFFHHFGMSPHDYLNSLKIQKAKELLDSGLYNVNEVADYLNFYDTSHFNKFFKRYCGMTPSKYMSD